MRAERFDDSLFSDFLSSDVTIGASFGPDDLGKEAWLYVPSGALIPGYRYRTVREDSGWRTGPKDRAEFRFRDYPPITSIPPAALRNPEVVWYLAALSGETDSGEKVRKFARWLCEKGVLAYGSSVAERYRGGV